MTVYLDHNATTPIDPETADLHRRGLVDFPGNPSSVHAPGRRSRAALEEARNDLAAALRVYPEEIVFTGSGSEANNLAIKGFVSACAGSPAHLVVSAIEHVSVLHAARAVVQRFPAVSMTEVAPGPDGGVRPEAIAAAMRPETRIVCLMHANNETGSIQPVAEVARLVRERGAHLHCDAVQTPGRVAFEPAALGWDSCSVAAHKFYGPKGVGALIVRRGTRLDPLIHGGNQEGIRRAGTENVAGAIAMAFAARRAVERLGATRAKLARLEAIFLAALRLELPELEINGAADDKVPGVVNVSIPGASQDDLVVGMDLAGFAISAGSACSSGVIEPSHVLTAMGLSRRRVEGAVRISFGAENGEDQAAAAAQALAALSRRLQEAAPAEEAL